MSFNSPELVEASFCGNLAGLILSVRPMFPRLSSTTAATLCRTGVCVAGAAAVVLTWNIYTAHIRPNLGFYEEPHRVAKHPAFQKQQREMIERNLW